MGKNRNGRISERQLRMLEMRCQGMTLSEIGEHFGITGEGVRVNVNVAVRFIGKHGLNALPDGCTTPYTVQELCSVRPKKKLGSKPIEPKSLHGGTTRDFPHTDQTQKKQAHMNDRFICINDQEFSFEEVAKALGVEVPSDNAPEKFQLCQRVDAGILMAHIFDYGGDYPGIDVELHLPEKESTIPIPITRTEQPHEEGLVNQVRTYSYGRNEEYFMYFDADVRPDREVDIQAVPPSVVIAGDPGLSVDVWTENPYMNYKGHLPAEAVWKPNEITLPEKVAYYRGNVAEQVTVLVDGGYVTPEQQVYLESHLNEITEQYVIKCDTWEASNGRTAPLDVEMDFIHKEILAAAGKAPAKSLDAQIAGARSRGEIGGSIAAETPEKDLDR